MLVLNRKLGQEIVVGDRITVKIIEVDRGRVRIGIAAPDDCRILRGELNRQQESRPRLVDDCATAVRGSKEVVSRPA